MSTIAQIMIGDDGARCCVVSCLYSRTLIDAPPDQAAELGDDALVRVALTRHGLECTGASCDPTDLWAMLRDVPTSLAEARLVVAQADQAYARSRRN